MVSKLARIMNMFRILNSRHMLCIALAVALSALQSCASQAAMEAEQAAADQARIAAAQETARIAAEESREREAAEQRERQARIAEQQRIEAERRQQAEIAQREADARAREQARIREQQQQEAESLAQAAQERERKLARIAELENQIADLQSSVVDSDDANALYREAILVAEELVDVLTNEQTKYDNVDDQGNLLEPLAKDLIGELEDRKDSLVREAEAASR